MMARQKELILPSEVKPAPGRFKNLQGCYFKRRHTYERQQLELLANSDKWEVPGQAMMDILQTLEFRITQAYLPPDRWGETDFHARVIRVATDLGAQLHHKPAEQPVLIATVAHELAHIALKHLPRRDGVKPANWEVEATVWSYQFLCPWFLLQGRAEIRAIQKGGLNERRQLATLYDLAGWLCVTISFLRRALELYGVLEYGQLEYRKTERPRSGPDLVRHLLEDSQKAVNA